MRFVADAIERKAKAITAAAWFFREPINLAVLGFYVVAGIDAVWVSLAVARDFVPHVSVTASLLLVTVSVLITVPCFGCVFNFRDPERVVARIQQQALAAALSRPRATTGCGRATSWRGASCACSTGWSSSPTWA